MKFLVTFFKNDPAPVPISLNVFPGSEICSFGSKILCISEKMLSKNWLQ